MRRSASRCSAPHGGISVPVGISAKIERLLDKLLAGFPDHKQVDWQKTLASQWDQGSLKPLLTKRSVEVDGVSPYASITLSDIIGCDLQKNKLIANTLQFLNGYPANNVLLWGARGTGKSSLIKALLNEMHPKGLRLVEVAKSDLSALAQISKQLKDEPFYFIIYCDDLSFSEEDDHYKALKSALEGSIFSSGTNIIVVATSNRRHLVNEYRDDNTGVEMHNGQLHFGDLVEEKLSLSDRFGIWLSFYPISQQTYLDIVCHWVKQITVQYSDNQLVEHIVKDNSGNDTLGDQCRQAALKWALEKGNRSGRAAYQFAIYWLGQHCA